MAGLKNSLYCLVIGLLVSPPFFFPSSFADDVRMLRKPSSEVVKQQLQRTIHLKLAPMKRRERANGKIILTQLKGKVRVEFEGNGLLKGEYSIVAIPSCAGIKIGSSIPLKKFQTLGIELYRFATDYGDIMTEKSSEKFTLQPGEESSVESSSIAFFKIKKRLATALDCQSGSSPSVVKI